MDSAKLKYFVSAAQCMNFSEVARSYYISQPTISHQIGLLEQELGVELFTRHGTKLMLTDEGKFFLPIATKILGDMQDASLDIQRYTQGKTGRVSVLAAETCRAAYLRCLSEFSRRNPGVMLEVEITFTPVQAESIIIGDYDIYFSTEQLVKSSSHFDYLVTHQDRLCLVLPEHVEAPDSLHDFSFLKDIPFIALFLHNSTMIYYDIQRVFQKRNFTPHIAARYNRMDEVLLSVDAGIGFSILPYTITSFHNSKNAKCIPLSDDEFVVNCVAAWRRESKSNAARIFSDTIRDVFTHNGNA